MRAFLKSVTAWKEKYRGGNLGKKLIDYVAGEVQSLGFKTLNLCTDHIGYYEKFGFRYSGNCYHPWGEKTRIYQLNLAKITKRDKETRYEVAEFIWYHCSCRLSGL